MPSNWWPVFDRSLKAIMAILLFVMMILTTTDVIGRYAFNAPLPGGFEIVQYLMAVVVFAALPLTTAADGHLTVSLLGDRLTGAARRIHRIFVLTLSSVAIVAISWRMAEQAQILSRSKQVSGYLQFPLPLVAWTMAALAALAAVVVLVKLAAAILGRAEVATVIAPATREPGSC